MTTTGKRRKRSRMLKRAGSVAAVAALVLGFALWSAGTSGTANHVLTVIAIQPRGGEMIAVDSDAVAELHAAAPGNILLFSIAVPGGRVALESTACSADTSQYSCQQTTASTVRSSVNLVGRLAAGAPAVSADPYAPVRYTASYTAAHPLLSSVTLWLNLASADVPAGATAADLLREADTAIASGVWPSSCRGYSFRLVVPSTGIASTDSLGEAWWRTLIERCHGTLLSYTPDWLGYGTDSWNLPKLAHGVFRRATSEGVTFSVPAAVLFALNSSTLSPEARAALSEISDELVTRFAGLPVEVLGFTDASGTPQYNATLSTARASAVAAWLTQRWARTSGPHFGAGP